MLIDLFYLAGIKLVARYDEGETGCAGVLIFLAVFFYVIAIGLNILGYVYFAAEDACGATLWVNIVTTGILVGLPMLQLCNFNKQNSLLTTALVSVYVAYLAFVGQFSYGGNSCTPAST